MCHIPVVPCMCRLQGKTGRADDRLWPECTAGQRVVPGPHLLELLRQLVVVNTKLAVQQLILVARICALEHRLGLRASLTRLDQCPVARVVLRAGGVRQHMSGAVLRHGWHGWHDACCRLALMAGHWCLPPALPTGACHLPCLLPTGQLHPVKSRAGFTGALAPGTWHQQLPASGCLPVHGLPVQCTCYRGTAQCGHPVHGKLRTSWPEGPTTMD
jgi:hypothetical protein